MTNEQSPPVITRLIELAIVSICTGTLGAYIGVQMLEKDVSALKENQYALMTKIERMDSRLDAIRTDLYIPKSEAYRQQMIAPPNFQRKIPE